MNEFVKSHGLGNEYVVLNSEKLTFELNERAIEKICNINFGIGSDGILLKVPSSKADFGLRIFNPDGSEAEKSGNGLRIFCKYIYDYKYSKTRKFTVETLGGIVNADVIEVKDDRASLITIDMGKAIFDAADIPTNFTSEEVIGKKINILDKEFEINCVSMGNPHCVIVKNELDINEIKKYGPYIENYKMFPNKTNVQFAKVLGRDKVEVLIWERGAGFTLASGTSSCAVVSVLRKKNLVDNKVTVKLLGGELIIEVDDEFNVRMTGPIRQIAEGILNKEFIEDIKR
ncbi:diaminopimelate epimerase [uncultured Clostridium sp.]|uniref:diaminopimelate epimerase n=1 Tax=uncultured Clostridium sp. TaxID=59620 RepID=UPI002600BC29|nr:diaminopimelate epimerase [uncultured Clostridium sp.]